MVCILKQVSCSLLSLLPNGLPINIYLFRPLLGNDGRYNPPVIMLLQDNVSRNMLTHFGQVTPYGDVFGRPGRVTLGFSGSHPIHCKPMLTLHQCVLLCCNVCVWFVICGKINNYYYCYCYRYRYRYRYRYCHRHRHRHRHRYHYHYHYHYCYIVIIIIIIIIIIIRSRSTLAQVMACCLIINKIQ